MDELTAEDQHGLWIDELRARIEALEEQIKARAADPAPETPTPPLVWKRPKASDLPKAWGVPSEAAFTSLKSIGEQVHDDVDEFWNRAQFGYSPTGERHFSGSRLEYAYNLCDRLAAGQEDKDVVCMGASALPTLVAIVRILTGYFVGGGTLGAPRMVSLKYYPEQSIEAVLKGIFFEPLVIE